MNLFPIIQPTVAASLNTLPMYREVAWDYTANTPIWYRGSPQFVEGAEAVKVWIWNTLHTPRFRHEIYTRDYGHDLEDLFGQSYSDELKQSEAARYVKACLMINPYIKDVLQASVSFQGGVLEITCTVKTIYGEVSVDV